MDEQMVITLVLVIISNHSPSGLISEPLPGFWGPILSTEAENVRSTLSKSLLQLGPRHRPQDPSARGLAQTWMLWSVAGRRLTEAVGVCCQAARWLAHSDPSTALSLAPFGSGLFCQLSFAAWNKITPR